MQSQNLVQLSKPIRESHHLSQYCSTIKPPQGIAALWDTFIKPSPLLCVQLLPSVALVRCFYFVVGVIGLQESFWLVVIRLAVRLRVPIDFNSFQVWSVLYPSTAHAFGLQAQARQGTAHLIVDIRCKWQAWEMEWGISWKPSPISSIDPFI